MAAIRATTLGALVSRHYWSVQIINPLQRFCFFCGCFPLLKFINILGTAFSNKIIRFLSDALTWIQWWFHSYCFTHIVVQRNWGMNFVCLFVVFFFLSLLFLFFLSSCSCVEQVLCKRYSNIINAWLEWMVNKPLVAVKASHQKRIATFYFLFVTLLLVESWNWIQIVIFKRWCILIFSANMK